jgi:hypothetical protein
VAKVKDKVQNALDEARMLMLGTQVLIGFNFHAALEPGFDKLPPLTQASRAVSLALLLVTLGLLLWPGAFHQQVERGQDTPRVHRFTSRVMAVALLPFALALGLDLATPFEKVLGPSAGVIAGLVGALIALALWYGLELAQRHPGHGPVLWPANGKEASSSMFQPAAGTPLDSKIRHALTEARVVLPGAQALLGFQLIAVLADGFDKLPETSRQLHLVSLGLLALSIVLLMTPAAYHRIVEQGENTEHFHRFASRVVLAAMVPLALGIAADFYIVVDKVAQSVVLALGVTGLLLVFFFGCWFGYSIYARRARDRHQEDLRSTASATGIPRML